MIVTDEILNEWSFRCHDGIVDLNDPKKLRILKEILDENGIDLLKEDIQEDLTDIFKVLGNTENLTKTKTFDLLAQYTLDHYSNKPGMQDLKRVFPNDINKVPNWKSYVPEDEKKDNRGKEVEVFLKNYAIKQGVKDSELISGGRGKDVRIGNATVESKSDAGKNINTKLQTTYYSPDVYYAFVNNVASDDAEVRIVAGELLRKISFGQDLDETSKDFEDKLEKEIKTKLEQSGLDFTSMIKTALVQGPTKRTTSFFVGNKLKVRFVMYFEPAYSKDKELDEEYNEEN